MTERLHFVLGQQVSALSAGERLNSYASGGRRGDIRVLRDEVRRWQYGPICFVTEGTLDLGSYRVRRAAHGAVRRVTI